MMYVEMKNSWRGKHVKMTRESRKKTQISRKTMKNTQKSRDQNQKEKNNSDFTWVKRKNHVSLG